MKKGLSFAAAVIAVAAVNASPSSKPFATANDLYAKHPGGTCISLLNSTGVLTSEVRIGTTGQQATIKSDAGASYTLWNDNSCTGSANVIRFDGL